MLCMSPTPSIVEFNQILGSNVKNNNNHYLTIISLFFHLQFHKIMPDIATFTILINCYCHLGEMTLAFYVLAKILKIGYHPDIITFNTLINGMCLNGNVKEALHFHDHVIAFGSSYACYLDQWLV
jgi:pentatricopeptide repeat domain-containing protein 1